MVDSFVKVVEALAKLGAAITWPLAALTIFWWVRRPLIEFFANISEGSVKLFGIEAVAKRRAIEAAATAEAAKSGAPAKTSEQKLMLLTGGAGKSWRRLADYLSHVSLDKLAGKSVLWVDDNPANNRHEIEALKALGIEVELARSTTDALDKLRGNEYGAIISDMKRPEGDQAGRRLMSALEKVRPYTPFIFYTGELTSEEGAAISSEGAYGHTSNPSELIELVVSALRTQDYMRRRYGAR